jgi:hypothetical protein
VITPYSPSYPGIRRTRRGAAGRSPRAALAAGLADRVQRDGAQDVQLGAERGDQVVELRLDGLGLRADAVDLAEDSCSWIRCSTLSAAAPAAPVGEILDPAEHAHGQRLAALRAPAAVAPGLRRLPVDAAGAVAVGVVLALLGEELERAGQPVPVLDRE